MPETKEGENTAQNTDQQGDKHEEGAKALEWDGWLAEQDEPVKTLIDGRFKALENTVSATRDERDTLKGELKALRSKAEEGSELQKQLDASLAKLDTVEKKAVFLEEATKPGVECRNPKAAYTVAVASDLFTRSGAPDWDAIKKEAPELFGKAPVNSNGGNGTRENPEGRDMNSFIRGQAGRSA